MRRSMKRTASYAVVLASTLSVVLLQSCRNRNRVSKAASSADEGEDPRLASLRVIDCTPELCGKDVAVVGVNPDPEQLSIAMGSIGSQKQYALDDTAGTSKQSGPQAEKSLDQAAKLSDVAADTIRSDDQSLVANVSVTSLFQSLVPMLTVAHQAAVFADKNIIAENNDERLKTMAKIKGLSTELSKFSVVTTKNSDQIFAGLELFAGEDGWLNRGDMARMLPVIQNVVGRIADQKINQGYADGIAQLAAERPMAYNFWVRNPNGLIGSMVQSRIDSELQAAYGQKWQALNAASAKFQTEYNALMSTLGIEKYYLLARDKTQRYWDPAPAISEDQMGSVIESLTGKKISELIAASGNNVRAPFIPQAAALTASELAKKISMPDGIPIAEIRRYAKASEGFTKDTLPETLMFRSLPDGRLEITRDDGTKATPPADSEIRCVAVSNLKNGVPHLYVYSSVTAEKLFINTVRGYFEIKTPNASQPPLWLTVRSGPVDALWLKQDTISVQMEFKNGFKKICKGKVHHM